MAVLPQPPLVIPMASRLIGLLLYQYLGPVMQPGVETPFLGGWQVLQMGHSRTRAREDALCATSRDHCFYKFDTRARARAREPDTRARASSMDPPPASVKVPVKSGTGFRAVQAVCRPTRQVPRVTTHAAIRVKASRANA